MSDRMWDRVHPLLPPPRGGRPFAGDRVSFDGLGCLPRNGLSELAPDASFVEAG